MSPAPTAVRPSAPSSWAAVEALNVRAMVVLAFSATHTPTPVVWWRVNDAQFRRLGA
jgi:hypothetical protein